MPRRMTLVALAALAGCAHVGPGGGPEADRVQVPESERLDGRVVVQLDPETDRVLDPSYAGPLPDRPALLALAVGAAARDEALKAFGAYFRGGAEAKAAGAPSRGYRVLVVPRPLSQSPGYREARRHGVRPVAAVSLRLEATLLDPAGKAVWERGYDSGLMEGPAYFPRGAGVPRLGEAARGTIARLAERAASEAAAAARSSPPSAS